MSPNATMSIALISDIHGNSRALDAVLTDIESVGGADEVWALGDLVALGPDPAGVLERITALPRWRALSGNTERYVLTGERRLPTAEEAERRPHLAGLICSFAWTAGALVANGWLDWLSALPAELRAELPNGATVVGVHASPDRDDGPGIHDGVDDHELGAMLLEARADILCAGHTHRPFLRELPSGRVVNLGSVSNPIMADRRASYVLMRADGDRVDIQHRRAAYDIDAVLDDLRAVRHPGVAFLEHDYFRREATIG